MEHVPFKAGLVRMIPRSDGDHEELLLFVDKQGIHAGERNPLPGDRFPPAAEGPPDTMARINLESSFNDDGFLAGILISGGREVEVKLFVVDSDGLDGLRTLWFEGEGVCEQWPPDGEQAGRHRAEDRAHDDIHL